METRERSYREIIVFLVLTFGASSILWLRIIAAGGLEASGAGPVLLLMWCPGVAALVTRLAFGRRLTGLGWGWGATRYQLTSYGLPLLYALVAYGLVWLSGLGSFYDADAVAHVAGRLEVRYDLTPGSDAVTIAIWLALIATRGVLLGSIFALGEEIGWRGLLVGRLAKVTSFSGTALASGLIWALWHWPLILASDYRGPSVLFSLFAFTVLAVAVSFVMAWLRLRSASLWTAVFFHASHNAFVQSFFDRITAKGPWTDWAIGEFGFALPLVTIVVALWFWRRRGELPSTSLPA